MAIFVAAVCGAIIGFFLAALMGANDQDNFLDGYDQGYLDGIHQSTKLDMTVIAVNERLGEIMVEQAGVPHRYKKVD